MPTAVPPGEVGSKFGEQLSASCAGRVAQGGGRSLGLRFLGDFHTLKCEEGGRIRHERIVQAEGKNPTGTSDLLS